VNNTHIKQFTEKKKEIHLHTDTASALQKDNQALELCSKASFEEVMSRSQKNTWAFQDSYRLFKLHLFPFYQAFCTKVKTFRAELFSMDARFARKIEKPQKGIK